MLHVIPHVLWCQNFCNFKNPSVTANIITILVKTTISELYQFFLQTVVATFGQDQDHSSAHRARSSVRPLLVLWHGGQAPHGLQVMCVWSLGLLNRGKREAVAVKDKKGKCGRETISLKKMTNQVVFVLG